MQHGEAQVKGCKVSARVRDNSIKVLESERGRRRQVQQEAEAERETLRSAEGNTANFFLSCHWMKLNFWTICRIFELPLIELAAGGKKKEGQEKESRW